VPALQDAGQLHVLQALVEDHADGQTAGQLHVHSALVELAVKGQVLQAAGQLHALQALVKRPSKYPLCKPLGNRTFSMP
jgi:hypothetical protein